MSDATINRKIFESIQDIDDEVLSRSNPDGSLYFSKPFLEGFENHHTQVDFRYVVLDNGKESAVVVLQNFTVDLESATSHLKLNKTIARTLQCSLQRSTVNLQLCGNVFLSGSYGITASCPAFLKEAYVHIAAGMKREETTSFSFFKDFANPEAVAGNLLEDLNFLPFCVEPNMVLKIDPNWIDYDSYKKALKSKYRVKVNRADAMSEALTSRVLHAVEILEYRDQLQHLFNQVVNHADFKSITFNVATYIAWERGLNDRFKLTGYFLEEKLVGFRTAMHRDAQLDAHFIGIDYTLNKEHAIYPRMLNDYVRQSIDLKCKVLNLGRTSSEIKSTLGAVPQPLVCFVRHKRSIANLIFKPITKNMSATDFKMHNPLKK